ncbi:MAG: ribonuclease D [Sphingobacteriales bacterium]|nr:MAG: ribonuclease D [Sphingobacteriales bacterium]
MSVFHKEKEIILIETRKSLNRYCEKIRQESEIAIDTEFDRNRYRYGLNLCVVQIATLNRCYIIDPIKICPTDTEFQEYLSPLWDIVNSSEVLKIIYDCSEDLKVFTKYQCNPVHFFDLKVAEKVLALSSVSFISLIKNLAGIDLNKNLQVTNWYRRPFSEAMVQYLANDVNYLIEAKQILQTQLNETGRQSWFDEEMKLIITKQAIDTEDGTNKFFNSARFKRLSEKEKFIATELWNTRTEFAKKYNIPVHFVFSEDKLYEISSALPHYSKLRDWYYEKGVHRSLKVQDNHEFVQKLKAILSQSAQITEVRETNKTYSNQQKEDFKNSTDALKIEREAFKTFMQPVQLYLEQKYDKRTQEIILSNRYVQDLFKAKKLEVLKSYAVNEILKAARELEIDLSKYLKI